MLAFVIGHAHTHADSTSGWDIATAIGTIAAAVATAVAIGVALYVGGKDRRAAETAQETQLRAAEERQAAEHIELRQQRRQEHEVELLLALNAQIATYAAFQEADRGREAEHVLKGLVGSLPIDERFDHLNDLLQQGDYLRDPRLRFKVQVHLSELIQRVVDR